jgi:hypothetical protein
MMRPGPPPRPYVVRTTVGPATLPVTPEMFAALAQAIAGGVKSVSYADRSIDFFDLDDLMRAWEWLGVQLGVMAPAAPVRRVACFSKGLGGGSYIGGGIEHQEIPGVDVLFSRGVEPDPTRTDDVDWERGR